MTTAAETHSRAGAGGERRTLRARLLGDRAVAAEPVAVLADRWVWAALAVLMAFQLLYILFAHAPVGIGDQTLYLQLGHHFASWWFSGDVLRTPGYPFLLAVTYKLGLGTAGVKIWQALLVVAVAAAVAVLVGMASGRGAARGAAWLQAVYLPFFSYSSVVLSDVPAVAGGVLGTLCLVLAVRRRRLNHWWVLGAAALFMVATLIRPVYVVFALVAFAVLVVAGDSWRSRAAVLGIFLATFLVLFGPWIGRNYALDAHPDVLGRAGQVQIAWGLHLPWDSRAGEFAQYRRSYDFFTGRRPDRFDEAKAAEVDVWGTLARDLRERPGTFLWSRVVGQYQLWAWPVTARTQYALQDPVPFPLIMIEHLLLLGLGVLGLVVMRRHVVSRVMTMFVLITAAEYLVYFPTPRYTFAVAPFLVGAAAVGGPRLWDLLAGPSWRRFAPAPLRRRPAP